MQSLPSFISLLESTWAEYQNRSKSLSKFILWIIPIFAVCFFGFATFFGSFALGMLQQSKAIIWAGIAIGAVITLIGLLFALWFTFAFKAIVIKPETPAKGVWRATAPRLLGYLGLVILTNLILLGGFILFVIPAILFHVWFVFAPQYFVLGSGITESLKKSKALCENRWWNVALMLMGSYICVAVPLNIAQYVVKYIPHFAGIGSFLVNIVSIFVGMPVLLIFIRKLRESVEEANVSTNANTTIPEQIG